MRVPQTLLLALLTLAAVQLSGCREEGPAERAGREIDEAADEAGDALEDAAEDAEDAMD